MSDTTLVLDEAFERMAAASFELPNGFVNHGAMACEALAMFDCTGAIDSWARRFAGAGGASVDPVVPAGFEWRQALGDYHQAPGVDRLLHAGRRRRRCAGGGRGVGAAADARAGHRAVPRRHPDRPCRCGPSTRSTHRRGAVSWPGRWVTGRPATAPGGHGRARRPPLMTSGWRSCGPRPTAHAATWPGPTSSTCTASPAQWPWVRAAPHPGHGRRRRAGPGARRARRAVRGHRTGNPAAPGQPARHRPRRSGRAQPGPAPGQAWRPPSAGTRRARRSRLRRRRGNGHRHARLTGSQRPGGISVFRPAGAAPEVIGMPCIVFAGNAGGDQALARSWPFSTRTSRTPDARRIAARPQTCHDA